MMRIKLCEKYPSSDWAKKVKKMPDNQVVAIYERLRKAGAFDVRVARYVKDKAAHAYYLCEDCGKVFRADSPDLTECRFCGGRLTTDISKLTVERIEKNED